MHWSNPLYDICIGVIHCMIYALPLYDICIGVIHCMICLSLLLFLLATKAVLAQDQKDIILTLGHSCKACPPTNASNLSKPWSQSWHIWHQLRSIRMRQHFHAFFPSARHNWKV